MTVVPFGLRRRHTRQWSLGLDQVHWWRSTPPGWSTMAHVKKSPVPKSFQQEGNLHFCQCSHTMQTSTLFETFFAFFKDFKRILFLENTFLFLCYIYIFCTYIGTTIVLGIVHFARQNPPRAFTSAHYSLGRLSNNCNNGTLKAMNVLVMFLPFFS